MEITSNVTEQEKSWLASQKWYHQRFDGCPFIFSYIVYAHARQEPRKENGEARIMFNFFFDGKTDYYIDTSDNATITNFFLEQSKNDVDFTKKFMERWKDDEEAFVRIFNEVANADLTKLSNEELLVLNNKFGEAYVNRVTSSSVIDGFALGSDYIIAKKIQEHLKSIGRESNYNFLFSALTAPVHISFTNESEVSLLKIAQKIAKDPVLHQLFMQHSEDEIIGKLVDYGGVYKDFLTHQKNFYWLHNNYVDAHILPLEYFVYEIKKLFEEGHDIEWDLNFIINHPQDNKLKKDHLIQELNPPYNLVSLLIYSEDFTHWQDERKKATFFATHCFTLILDEIARRTGFTLMELKYLMPHELPLVFDGKINRKDLQKRMHDGFVTIVKPDNVSYLIGEEASLLYEQVKRLDVPKDLTVIKGLPASLGKATGKVRIVKSAKEIGKVASGDILVAVMTRPDYVIGMRKAAAIVTDEGGLTCHAAIVSRELRLPCVIATKFATHVLCDGDLIEVDASAGEVRVIERKT